jgi:hypothetical protein
MLLVSTIRLFLDPTGLEAQRLGQQVGEHFINTFTWVIPGLLLFVGCPTRERFISGTAREGAVGMWCTIGTAAGGSVGSPWSEFQEQTTCGMVS